MHAELRDRRAAALPAVAALGGVVLRALIFRTWGLALGGIGFTVSLFVADLAYDPSR